MDTELYHSEVYMPAAFKAPIYQGRLRYGTHAVKESLVDRFGAFNLPLSFFAVNATLIEAEYDKRSRQVIKQVWRQPLDATRDLVLVIMSNGFVKTVWINLKTDKHHTLNAARYVKRP
jgi:hypothetical protein